MEDFMEILKTILPACITGLVTFWITKYNYYKNVPLEKMELVYNRVYYPLYRLLQDDVGRIQMIEKSGNYLKKYIKYVDRSTIAAYNFLKENPNNKKAFNNFHDNIMSINTNLRRRLGYLEPNILIMYTYSAPKEKQIFRTIIDMVGMYITIFLITILPENAYFNWILGVLFLFFLIGFIVEILIVCCKFIRKCMEWLIGKIIKA